MNKIAINKTNPIFKVHVLVNNRELVKVLPNNKVIIIDDITFDEALQAIEYMAASLAKCKALGGKL